ncbi:PCMD domain-containing protein [Prevotella sp.]|uniref:PCMD domain-containing protein n=1 Tax=Prevotella sp. TaxID=59823 RepID=UPI002F9260E6
MMKVLLKIMLVPLLCTLILSCVQDEPLNAECDIEAISFHLEQPEEVFYNATDTVQSVSSTVTDITFSVRRRADITSLAPVFKITDGASIVPASGSAQDFSQGPVVYTVTSQDGAYHRTYRLAVKHETKMVNDEVNFDFEHVTLAGIGSKTKYYEWQELHEDGTLTTDWATGNGAFAITASGKSEKEFPSFSIDEGFEGKGVQLVTRSTGLFGWIASMPIAAGNLFYGTFNVESASLDPLHATQFGRPFDRKPLHFTGYYQYAPGEKLTDRKSKPIKDQTDEGSIYAVFYRNHDADGKAFVLDGTNVKTSELIVAIADMGPVKPMDKWTSFDLEFKYTNEIDLDLLANRGYSLAIVFSSSRQGDNFIGAVGSKLMVDKVKIICEKEDVKE